MRDLLAGAVAGLGVALPLGAIGVLLLTTGLEAGAAAAAAAAVGVAGVDAAYALLALLAGSGLTRALSGHERTVHLVAATVLVAVALRGITALWRAPADGAPPEPNATAGERTPLPAITARFVALTALNPLTGIYFVALAAGLGSSLSSPQRGAAFVAGVGLASLGWQLALGLTGAIAGARLPASARTVTGVAGRLVVLGYAVLLVLDQGQ